MKIITCGGRAYNDNSCVRSTMDELLKRYRVEQVANGAATGADELVRRWCADRGISYMGYPANWLKYGPAAGPIRNKEMLASVEPDLVIAFPGGKGTAHMVKIAFNAGCGIQTVWP